jgi:hypothetical protein
MAVDLSGGGGPNADQIVIAIKAAATRH